MPAPATIPLYRGRGKNRTVVGHAVVDQADHQQLSQWRWGLHDGYAVRYVGKDCMIRMHREITGLEHGDPREVDHRDRDRLNNTRTNLRVVSQAANRQNKSACRTSRFGPRTSKHRGVCWVKSGQKWHAYVTVDGRRHNLGFFEVEEEAARVAAEFRAQQMPYATS